MDKMQRNCLEMEKSKEKIFKIDILKHTFSMEGGKFQAKTLESTQKFNVMRRIFTK
jgi:hypothetical protein